METDRDGVRTAADAPHRTLTSFEVRVETHRLFSRRLDDVESAVLDAAHLTGTEVVLDLGSGTATFVRHLVESGHRGRVLALDLAHPAYLAAREVPGVEAIHASADEIPLPAGSVDVVVARHMLDLCPAPAAVVAEAARVLADDGVLVVTVNHARTVPMIRHVIETELGALGLATAPAAPCITTDSVAGLVGQRFTSVEVVSHDNELVFDEPAPLVRFATSLFALYGVDETPAVRDQLVRRVTARVEDWFASSSSAWLEPKGYSVCTARGVRARTA